MQAPVPVSQGTALYIGAAFVIIIWFYAFHRGGYVSKDSFQYVSITLPYIRNVSGLLIMEITVFF